MSVRSRNSVCPISDRLEEYQLSEVEYIKMGNPGPAGQEIKVNNLYLTEGGVPQVPVMGEFHYSRMDPRYWRDALLKNEIVEE